MNVKYWVGGVAGGLVRWVAKKFLSISGAVAQEKPIPSRDWGSYAARRMRHALFTALYECTSYSDIHKWAGRLKEDHGLYFSIRNLFNPFYRLVEFWATHLYCGSIDPAIGDGKVVPSAIPIETDSDAVRPAIGIVFEASDWETNKTVYGRLGAMTGEVGLFAVDDTLNGVPYLEVVDPSSIVEYACDAVGNCQRYAIEEWRPDPRPDARKDADGEVERVLYREVGELVRDGETGLPVACRFRTFLDGEAFDWASNAPVADGEGVGVWTEPYPFVPFALVAHQKILPRSPFGVAEGSQVVSKIFGVDDLASRFHDFIYKQVDPIWLFKGVREADMKLVLQGGKDGLPALYGGTEAGAQALIAALNVGDVTDAVEKLKEELKDDFPELRRDIEQAVGDASGAALRAAQQRLVTKAQTRRAGYDAVLRRMIACCIRIGGIRKYPGFEAFTPRALADDPNLINFRIGDRPVFRQALIDELAAETAYLANAESADRAGITVTAYLELTGRKAWIPVVERERKKAMDLGLAIGRSKQASPPNEPAAEALQTPGGSAP
jgi:hypothetical protein